MAALASSADSEVSVVERHLLAGAQVHGHRGERDASCSIRRGSPLASISRRSPRSVQMLAREGR